MREFPQFKPCDIDELTTEQVEVLLKQCKLWQKTVPSAAFTLAEMCAMMRSFFGAEEEAPKDINDMGIQAMKMTHEEIIGYERAGFPGDLSSWLLKRRSKV